MIPLQKVPSKVNEKQEVKKEVNLYKHPDKKIKSLADITEEAVKAEPKPERKKLWKKRS